MQRTDILIRQETPCDPSEQAAIREVVRRAFLSAPHTCGQEAEIVDRLRAANALGLSLVAECDGVIVGHLATSAAEGAPFDRWQVLGPLAVLPDWQGQGVGSSLMRQALSRLRRVAEGIVLVGEPAFYGRFCFTSQPGVTMAGVLQEVLLLHPFRVEVPMGEVRIHPAFEVRET